MRSKADQWMDDIAKDHGVVKDSFIGVEIVGRIIIRDESDHQYIEEVLEKIREIGAAEITQHVKI